MRSSAFVLCRTIHSSRISPPCYVASHPRPPQVGFGMVLPRRDAPEEEFVHVGKAGSVANQHTDPTRDDARRELTARLDHLRAGTIPSPRPTNPPTSAFSPPTTPASSRRPPTKRSKRSSRPNATTPTSKPTPSTPSSPSGPTNVGSTPTASGTPSTTSSMKPPKPSDASTASVGVPSSKVAPLAAPSVTGADSPPPPASPPP